jgi:hypothetical protein
VSTSTREDIEIFGTCPVVHGSSPSADCPDPAGCASSTLLSATVCEAASGVSKPSGWLELEGTARERAACIAQKARGPFWQVKSGQVYDSAKI